MDVRSVSPGDTRAGCVTGDAIPNARIGVHHLVVHDSGGSRCKVAGVTGCGKRGVTESDKRPPVCRAGDMTFATIATAAVNDLGAGIRSNGRGRPIEGVAGLTTRAAESSVVRNPPGNHSINLLAGRCLQTSGQTEQRQYDEATYAHHL